MPRDYVLQPFNRSVELKIDYRGELNEPQYQAVTAPPGPSLVIAGAGSGKTRTLTYRVAYLLEQGVRPERILLLTFTNKAAREMMERVNALLGEETSVWGGTFHSIGHRILRRHADAIGFQRDFTILDREDSKDLVKACIGAADIDTKSTRFPKPDVVQNVISLATNMQKSIDEVVGQHYGHFGHLGPQLEELGKAYSKRKKQGNVMDFDDLLVQWLRLLKDDEEARERYQRRFQFILVDEYQDTNRLQSDVIDILAEKHRNVMVVGDDSQSIYSWRGANFQNIFDFGKRYEGAKQYNITVNYRSTPNILAVANASIAANLRQFQKELRSAREEGQKPALVTCEDSNQQAAFVAQRVLELREEGTELDNMAVLYRSHFHALELQLELTKRNIPFSITSGIRFFEQAHVKDVAAYLKLICNPLDEVSFKRIILLFRGIGAKGADKLWNEFYSRLAPEVGEDDLDLAPPKEPAPALAPLPEDDDDPDWSVEEEPPPPVNRVPIGPHLKAMQSKAPKKASTDWEQFAETVSQLEDPELLASPASMIRLILDAGYEDHLKETYTNYSNRMEDLEQLGNFAMQFDGIEDFLAQLALLTNVEAEQSDSRNDDEQLKLSSIHQAKGLEFDIVFLIMLCDGLFPSSRSLEDPDTLEEERRLFYVAVTRAKNELYLSYPIMRMSQGYGDYIQSPSRFIGEVPPDLLDEWNLRSYSSW